MSDFYSNSEIPKISLSPAGQAALAEKLQDIARDLLKFHHANNASTENRSIDLTAHDDEQEGLTSENGEVHCYYLCPYTLRNVRTLLQEEDASDWQDLLCNIYTSLHGFNTLLENIQPEADLKGFVLHFLARELKRIENLLLSIQDAYGTAERIDISC